jgi:predicted dienelactone hydrolase
MRPLEWLLLLSFIPALLLPIVPQRWRRPWLTVAALLPLLMTVIHLLVEGWRIQMIPVYGLALLVLLVRLSELLGRQTTVRRRWGFLASIVDFILLVGCAVFAGWLLPVVKLPQPTGPYPVGIVDRQLTDKSRSRKLMVSVWYPAAQSGTPAPLTHYPDEVAAGMGNVSGLPGVVLQHLRYFTVAASENAPVLINSTPFPVLVFSHATVGLRLQSSTILQELASWGYVVVAIDHTDGAAVTVFPDGEADYYDLTRFGIPADVEPNFALMNEHVLPVWIADQRFVYDTIEKWQANDPLFAGKLDVNKIASFGHSFGGATSLEVCRIDDRCRAAVDLDGGLYGDSFTQPATRPLMLMTSTESNQYTDTVQAWSHLVTSATDGAYWLELPDSSHLSFTISQLISPILAPSGFDPYAGLRTIDKYLRLFFDIQLRGADPQSLRPNSNTTDVVWLSQ